MYVKTSCSIDHVVTDTLMKKFHTKISVLHTGIIDQSLSSTCNEKNVEFQMANDFVEIKNMKILLIKDLQMTSCIRVGNTYKFC